MMPTSAPPAPALPPLITVAQFAAFMGWSDKAVRHRIDRGQLPGVTRVGRTIYLRRDVVLPFVLEGRGQSPIRSR